MANIFTLENIEDFTENLNIDDLYSKKQQYDLHKLELFNKILNRIHARIKITARQNLDVQYCWYLVPEIIIGVPKYDQGACIAYLIDKLKNNQFIVRYIHPNLLFISWMHWVPSYVRTEIQKKTGMVLNELGEQVTNNDDNTTTNTTTTIAENIDNSILNIKQPQNDTKTKTIYTPIQKYAPSGNLF